MGCGKSSVGRELSRLLCCPFMDLDAVIEERAGRSIPEIFAADGEAAFRCMEVEALHGILGDMGCLGRSLRSPHRCAPLAVPPLSCRGWHGPRPPHNLQDTANSIHQGGTPRPPHNLQESDEAIHQGDMNVTHDGNCEAVVLALGGGTVMTRECEEMVHEKTLCVYLRTSAQTLAERLAGEADGRPMLAGNLMDRINDLMALRSETYERTAHLIVDTDGKSVEEIAMEIYRNLEKMC